MFQQSAPTLAGIADVFLNYARAELSFSAQSVVKYRECIRHVSRIIGDVPVTDITQADVLRLKSDVVARNLSVSRQVSFLAALKRLLQFSREHLELAALDPNKITMPRRPRRDVTYLTASEVEQFVAAIPTATNKGCVFVDGLRFRALVEALLGSAVRIGELLSLNRASIDFGRLEAQVIGKGNKERTIFFTERAASWIKRYLDARTDDHPALFVTRGGLSRLSQLDIWRPFRRYRELAGLTKPVRPHLLRHTAATQLLFNGCPIGHIKEILGHERLETTCRYYLGLDHRAAKQAHQQYLVYA